VTLEYWYIGVIRGRLVIKNNIIFNIQIWVGFITAPLPKYHDGRSQKIKIRILYTNIMYGSCFQDA